jgi:hypothetical protein
LLISINGDDHSHKAAFGSADREISNMKCLGLACLVVLFSSVSAYAETRLICENAQREYLMIYSPGASELVLNPDSDRTFYSILVDDLSDGSHVVTAATPNGGPTARLHLRPYLKMEFWSGGQVVQTDGCYTSQ